MKTKKTITLEIPLPSEGMYHIDKTASFMRYLTEAASKLMKKTCNDVWIGKVYVEYLQTMEMERRKAFKKRIAELRSKVDPSSTLETATSDITTSKKAPVATDRRTAEEDEG